MLVVAESYLLYTRKRAECPEEMALNALIPVYAGVVVSVVCKTAIFLNVT